MLPLSFIKIVAVCPAGLFPELISCRVVLSFFFFPPTNITACKNASLFGQHVGKPLAFGHLTATLRKYVFNDLVCVLRLQHFPSKEHSF